MNLRLWNQDKNKKISQIKNRKKKSGYYGLLASCCYWKALKFVSPYQQKKNKLIIAHKTLRYNLLTYSFVGFKVLNS